MQKLGIALFLVVGLCTAAAVTGRSLPDDWQAYVGDVFRFPPCEGGYIDLGSDPRLLYFLDRQVEALAHTDVLPFPKTRLEQWKFLQGVLDDCLVHPEGPPRVKPEILYLRALFLAFDAELRESRAVAHADGSPTALEWLENQELHWADFRFPPELEERDARDQQDVLLATCGHPLFRLCPPCPESAEGAASNDGKRPPPAADSSH